LVYFNKEKCKDYKVIFDDGSNSFPKEIQPLRNQRAEVNGR
jgi:hypothetical protein